MKRRRHCLEYSLPKDSKIHCRRCSRLLPHGVGRRRGVYGEYYCKRHGDSVWYFIKKRLRESKVLEACFARLPHVLAFCKPLAIGYQRNRGEYHHVKRLPPYSAPTFSKRRRRKNTTVACSECDVLIYPRDRVYRGPLHVTPKNILRHHCLCARCGLRYRRWKVRRDEAEQSMRLLVKELPDVVPYLRDGVMEALTNVSPQVSDDGRRTPAPSDAG